MTICPGLTKGLDSARALSSAAICWRDCCCCCCCAMAVVVGVTGRADEDDAPGALRLAVFVLLFPVAFEAPGLLLLPVPVLLLDAPAVANRDLAGGCTKSRTLRLLPCCC